MVSITITLMKTQSTIRSDREEVSRLGILLVIHIFDLQHGAILVVAVSSLANSCEVNRCRLSHEIVHHLIPVRYFEVTISTEIDSGGLLQAYYRNAHHDNILNRYQDTIIILKLKRVETQEQLNLPVVESLQFLVVTDWLEASFQIILIVRLNKMMTPGPCSVSVSSWAQLQQ